MRRHTRTAEDCIVAGKGERAMGWAVGGREQAAGKECGEHVAVLVLCRCGSDLVWSFCGVAWWRPV